MWYNYPEYLESGVAGQNPTEWFGVDAVDGDAGDWIQVGAGSMYMYRDLTNDLMQLPLVKIKNEIIRMNHPAIRPEEGRANFITPKKLQEWLEYSI